MPWVRFAIACAVIAGCSADPADRPKTWSYLHAAILAPSCATSSCHSARAAVAGVVLDDVDVGYETLTDPERNYIVPGDPGSTLMALLEGEERRRMPPDAPLPQADIDLIRAWIEAGAPR